MKANQQFQRIMRFHNVDDNSLPNPHIIKGLRDQGFNRKQAETVLAICALSDRKIPLHQFLQLVIEGNIYK